MPAEDMLKERLTELIQTIPNDNVIVSIWKTERYATEAKHLRDSDAYLSFVRKCSADRRLRAYHSDSSKKFDNHPAYEGPILRVSVTIEALKDSHFMDQVLKKCRQHGLSYVQILQE